MQRHVLASFALLLVACRPESTPPSPDASIDAAAAAPPTTRAVEEVTIAIDDAPIEAKPLTLAGGKTVSLPGIYAGKLDEPARWLVYNGKKVSVVDRASGRTLGTIDGAFPESMNPKHARLQGWQGTGADQVSALLSLVDGRVRIPKGRLADGKPVKIDRILADDSVDEILVLGVDAEKKRWFGFWKPASGDDVLLDKAAPMSSRSVTFDPVEKSFILYYDNMIDPPAKDEDCAAARVDEKGSECFLKVSDGAGRSRLDNRFAIIDHALRDLRTRRDVRSTIDGMPALSTTLKAPARALFVTNAGKTDPDTHTLKRRFEILAPEGSLGTFVLDVRSDEKMFGGPSGDTSDPVIAGHALAHAPKGARGETSTTFIDIERARVFTLPIAVDTLSRSRLPRRFLAVERGQANDKVILVDLDKPKATRLGTMPSCPGPYSPLLANDGPIAFVCTQQAPGGVLSLTHHWSEIVSADATKRWHVEGEPLAMLPGGQVLLSPMGIVISEGQTPAKGALAIQKLD